MGEDANREQLEHWNGTGGQRWVREQERLDRALAALGAAAVACAAPRPGERVIDVGCGCGASTLALADEVAPGGAVLGVDISAPMLARARERARERPWVRFEQSDAARFAFAGDAQLVFSRFGAMFFGDPIAAFGNLRRALGLGGRLCLLCWRSPQENPWINVAFEAAVAVLGPPPPLAPNAPGPFSLAAAVRVRALLGAAGFSQIALDPLDHVIELSRAGLDEAVSFAVEAGPVARLLLQADESARHQVLAAVRGALEPHAQGSRIALGCGAWIVTARA